MKKTKNTKKQVRKIKNTRKYRGGDCGCSKIYGGYGAPSFKSFDQLPRSSYYLPNDYKIDQNNPSVITSSRNLPNFPLNGGKPRKVRFSKKRRFFRGGSSDFLLGNTTNNGILSFGNYGSVSDFNGMINQNGVDPAPNAIPTVKYYGVHNNPLI